MRTSSLVVLVCMLAFGCGKTAKSTPDAQAPNVDASQSTGDDASVHMDPSAQAKDAASVDMPDAAAPDSGHAPYTHDAGMTSPTSVAACAHDTDCPSGFACVQTQATPKPTWSCLCHVSEEICDRRDNDCDGATDEHLADCCNEGATQSCGSSVGECSEGLQTCLVNGWSECAGSHGPSREVCDGLDNDCDPSTADGSADPSLQTSCDGDDADSCSEGVRACVDGKLVCTEAGPTHVEVCDDVDNDCDGMVDEVCAHPPSSARDFDVRADGGSVLVGVSGQDFWLMCVNADGTPASEAQTVASVPSGLSARSMDVVRSRVSGNIAVTFSYWNWPNSTYDWRNFIAFYDADCKPVKAAAALDSDLPNTNINREASLSATDDGRIYAIYEHQSEQKFRVLGFDANGTRSVAVTIPTTTECGGGALRRELALDASSGNFTVFCERNGRSYRRYSADGTALDASYVTIADSTPVGFAFHAFTGAKNKDGTFIYVGRNRQGTPSRWIVRIYAADGHSLASSDIEGISGTDYPRARVTSRGDFLVQIGGPDYDLALISAAGEIRKHWSGGPSNFELDGNDNVWVLPNTLPRRSTTITLY